jgi:hypothetical protein
MIWATILACLSVFVLVAGLIFFVAAIWIDDPQLLVFGLCAFGGGSLFLSVAIMAMDRLIAQGKWRL